MTRTHLIRRRRVASAVLALAGIAAAVSAPAPAVADDADVARAVVGSESEARAAWEANLRELVDAFEKDPGSPYAAGVLSRIRSLTDECRGAEEVERRLEPVLRRGIPDGEIEESLRNLLADRAWQRGDWDAARGYDAGRGYLRRFGAVGPLGWADSALVHRRYGPEGPELDPRQTWEGSRRKVGWVRLDVDPDTAWVDPWTRLDDAGAGIWYATARVRAAGTRHVVLKAVCRDSFRVLVNGRAAVVADRDRDEVPWAVLADATLVDGWNRILVKVAGRSAFALKVCDPATGLPADGIEEGDPLEAGRCPPAGAEPPARSWRTPVERALADASAEGLADAARQALAADMAGDDGRRWDAYRLYELAAGSLDAAALGGSVPPALAANVRSWRAAFLAGFDPYPPVQRKLRAKGELEQALRAFPGHVGASVRLAEYEDEDDHPDRAVKSLRELLAQGESVNAWMSLAHIARRRGWESESVDAAAHALAVQPNAGYVLDFLNDVDARLGDHEAVEARLRRKLEIDRSDRGAAAGLADRLRAQGRHDEALAALQELAARWPHEPQWARRIADVLHDLGRDDEALAAWRALEERLPVDEAMPRRIGEILEVRGDREGALAAYRRSLAIEPYQPAVWKATARLEGADEDFAAAYEPDVHELLAALPPTEELKRAHPKAVAVTVLDHSVTRVHPDGSSRAYVHMVYKVLDEKGVEKYGSLPNRGELLEVRAILPDGAVTTPTGLPGRPFNVEGLVPGTVLDHRFVVSERATPKGFDGGRFFFQDFEIDQNPNPVLLSRWVVLTPESMRLDPRPRNFANPPKVETRDGWTVTSWENRDAPIVEPERFRPPDDEIFPLVDYSIPPTFEDAAWQLFSQRPDSRGSPMVDAAVAGAVGPEMSDVEKLRAIYDLVNREITGESSSGGGATAVLLEKSGSRDLLLESMIRSAGIPYRMGRAVAWNGSGRALRDQEPRAFSAPFLWCEPRGADPFPLFVLGHHLPFGLVPEPYRGSAAFLLDERGGEIVRLGDGGLPVDDSASFRITLGADASAATLEGTLRYRSPNGYAFKRTLLDWSEDDRRKFAERQFSGWFANPKLESFSFPALGDRGAPLDLDLRGTMTTYLNRQGDVWVATLGLPETQMTQRFVDRADRRFDLVLNSRDDRVDEFSIDLGDAWEVESLPEDHVAVHDVGVYSLTWRRDGRTVRVRRERHLQPARYRPDEYRAFVAWCKSIDDAESRKLELRSAR